jgi:arginine repressor
MNVIATNKNPFLAASRLLLEKEVINGDELTEALRALGVSIDQKTVSEAATIRSLSHRLIQAQSPVRIPDAVR